MDRWYKVCFLSILALGIIASTVKAKDESITITTYYPSPVGIYRTLRLHPKDTAPQACASDNDVGYMYYNSTSQQLLVCRKTSLGPPPLYAWEPVSGTAGGFSNFVLFDTPRVDVDDPLQEWIVPAGVTKIMVEVWGGGGGCLSIPGCCGYAVVGGGGGGYGKDIFTVVPGTTYTVVVGIGGLIPWTWVPDGGEASSFGNLIKATGGQNCDKGGNPGNSNARIALQGGFSSKNDSYYQGGNGANGGNGGTNVPTIGRPQVPGGGASGPTVSTPDRKDHEGAHGRVIVWY